jgi:acetyl-CoA C-acetyltransferase/acetyl-CoA acyltransferase
MKKVKIKSAYMTGFGKLDEDYLSLVLDAARAIFDDRDPRQVSAVYLSSFAPGPLCGIRDLRETVSRVLAKEFPSLEADYHGPFKTGGEALFACLERFEGTNALVLGCEKMTHMDAQTSSGMLSETVNPHDRSYGATLPSLGALVTRFYQEKYSVPDRALHQVAVKNHDNALLNPKAHFHKRVTIEDVARSPLVSDPLRRLHCAPTSDGAVAVLLSAQEGDATISGWGKGVDAPLFHERTRPERFRATSRAFHAALEATNVTREDIGIVEIHDAFSSFELINLEELGFYAPGTAWRALAAGELNINGRLAVNPSGGLKARGHPIGVCGLSSLVEIFEQLTQSAGPRQHEHAHAGIIQSAGGVSDTSYVFIINQ